MSYVDLLTRLKRPILGITALDNARSQLPPGVSTWRVNAVSYDIRWRITTGLERPTW